MRVVKDNFITFEEGYSHIEEYYNKIKSGEIVANNKVTTLVTYLYNELDSEESEYYYDEQRGNAPIIFIENFIQHYIGDLKGKPFILELWQRAIISALFGFIHRETGLRRYRELLLMVSRKNGREKICRSKIG